MDSDGYEVPMNKCQERAPMPLPRPHRKPATIVNLGNPIYTLPYQRTEQLRNESLFNPTSEVPCAQTYSALEADAEAATDNSETPIYMEHLMTIQDFAHYLIGFCSDDQNGNPDPAVWDELMRNEELRNESLFNSTNEVPCDQTYNALEADADAHTYTALGADAEDSDDEPVYSGLEGDSDDDDYEPVYSVVGGDTDDESVHTVVRGDTDDESVHTVVHGPPPVPTSPPPSMYRLSSCPPPVPTSPPPSMYRLSSWDSDDEPVYNDVEGDSDDDDDYEPVYSVVEGDIDDESAHNVVHGPPPVPTSPRPSLCRVSSGSIQLPTRKRSSSVWKKAKDWFSKH